MAKVNALKILLMSMLIVVSETGKGMAGSAPCGKRKLCQIAINIPEAVLYDTHMTAEEAHKFARRAVALCYYSQSGVSIGYCAQIAGMTEEDFIEYLGDNNNPFKQKGYKNEYI